MMPEATYLALTRSEWTELAHVVTKAKRHRLSMDDEARLRYLVSRNRPRAQALPWTELLDEARLQLGLLWLSRQP